MLYDLLLYGLCVSKSFYWIKVNPHFCTLNFVFPVQTYHTMYAKVVINQYFTNFAS